MPPEFLLLNSYLGRVEAAWCSYIHRPSWQDSTYNAGAIDVVGGSRMDDATREESAVGQSPTNESLKLASQVIPIVRDALGDETVGFGLWEVEEELQRLRAVSNRRTSRARGHSVPVRVCSSHW